MEKLYQDYAWNLNQAVDWFKRIGKHKKAEEYWTAHLKVCENIKQEFKRIYRT